MNQRIRLAAITAVFALMVFATATATAQPRWVLKVKPGDPGVVAVFDVLNQGKDFWFFPFTVTNKTGKDQKVLITVNAMTDTKKTYLSGYYPDAFKKVQRILGRKIRGMREMRGVIKPGESWTGVALFKSVDPNMDRITFQIRGVEDVIIRIKGVSFVEERALEFNYRQLGDEYFPWEEPIEFIGKRWKILKQRTKVKRR